MNTKGKPSLEIAQDNTINTVDNNKVISLPVQKVVDKTVGAAKQIKQIEELSKMEKTYSVKIPGYDLPLTITITTEAFSLDSNLSRQEAKKEIYSLIKNKTIQKLGKLNVAVGDLPYVDDIKDSDIQLLNDNFIQNQAN